MLRRGFAPQCQRSASWLRGSAPRPPGQGAARAERPPSCYGRGSNSPACPDRLGGGGGRWAEGLAGEGGWGGGGQEGWQVNRPAGLERMADPGRGAVPSVRRLAVPSSPQCLIARDLRALKAPGLPSGCRFLCSAEAVTGVKKVLSVRRLVI